VTGPLQPIFTFLFSGKLPIIEHCLGNKKMKARTGMGWMFALFLCFCPARSSLVPAAAASQDQKLTITDSLGREVAIPPRIERILSLQPEITRIIVALGAGERLVSLDYFLRHDDHLFKIIFPQESRLPLVSKPDDSVNKELIVRLDPDVVFASPSEFQVPDSIQRTSGYTRPRPIFVRPVRETPGGNRTGWRCHRPGGKSAGAGCLFQGKNQGHLRFYRLRAFGKQAESVPFLLVLTHPGSCLL